MKKKVMAMVLMTAMVLGTVGCGSNETEKKEESTESSTAEVATSESASEKEPEVSEEQEEPVHISFWVASESYIAADQVGEDAVIAAMNEYTKEKINVTFDFTIDTNEALQLDLATTDNTDMFWISNANMLSTLITQNAVMDITELLPEYEALYSSIPELIWESTEFSGKNYVVPVMKESFTGYSMMSPVEMVEKVEAASGIKFSEIEMNGAGDIGKLTEYIDAAAALDPAVVIIKLPGFSNLMNVDSVYSLVTSGVGLDSATGKIVDLYGTQAYKDYITAVREWNEKGYIMDGYAAGSVPSSEMNLYRKSGSDTSGSYAVTVWNTIPDNQNSASVRYGIDVETVEIGQRNVLSNTMMSSDWAISAKSEKAEACLKFIELLNTDKYLADLYTYGIEGTHFNYTEDGRVTKIADSGWENQVWVASSVFTVSPLESEAIDKHEIYEQDNAAAVAAPTMGFRYDSTNTSAEISALSNVNSEYVNLLEYGFYDPDEYLEKFLAARKAAGVEKIIADMQEQYDAWVAAK